MEFLLVVLGAGFIVWLAVVWADRRRRADHALESWAVRSDHRWDDDLAFVSGVIGGRRFVAGMEARQVGFGGQGNREAMPIMMFPGPFRLPESEFLYRERFGVTSVIGQVGILRRLRLDTPEFRARSHELLSKDRRFLADAWALGLGDILSGPTVPLSYRIRPDGQLEVHRVSGWGPAWDEPALDAALATGGRLCELLESMAGRGYSA